MFTRVKTEHETERMRESGKRLATVLAILRKAATVGMSGKDASQIVRKELDSLGGEHAFLGYYGFPDVICISVNDEVVHGIPNDRQFKDGDIVSFDYGVKFEGMITDAAISVIIGDTGSADAKKLVQTTERSLLAGIEQLRAGVKVGDISAAVQKVLDTGNYGIVRDLVGHGVGHQVHEDPNIPNYGVAGNGPSLKVGMTIAIEPMATLGGHHVKVDPDGWTIRTQDGSLAAHFEHTVLITQNGYEILTDLSE